MTSGGKFNRRTFSQGMVGFSAAVAGRTGDRSSAGSRFVAPMDVLQFGAVPDTTLDGTGTNSTRAFSAALARNESVLVPFGNYLVDADELVVGATGNPQLIYGTGKRESLLISRAPSGTIVKVTRSFSAH